jgi:LPXTG-motif cell wall-anchored protein
MRKRKRKKEWLPWYRARDYKGDLTEAEKRQLDAFRTQPTHPAARLDQLPEEVRDYIREIDLELYERKEQEVGLMILLGLSGAVLLVLNYFGVLAATSVNWSYVGGALLLAAAWFFYKRRRHKNKTAEEPDGIAIRPTDEAILRAWELNYIVEARMAAQEASQPSP